MHLPVLVETWFEVRGSVVQEGMVVGNSVVTFYVFYWRVGTDPDTSLLRWLNVKVR